jgi:hypothetical protein
MYILRKIGQVIQQNRTAELQAGLKTAKPKSPPEALHAGPITAKEAAPETGPALTRDAAGDKGEAKPAAPENTAEVSQGADEPATKITAGDAETGHAVPEIFAFPSEGAKITKVEIGSDRIEIVNAPVPGEAPPRRWFNFCCISTPAADATEVVVDVKQSHPALNI